MRQLRNTKAIPSYAIASPAKRLLTLSLALIFGLNTLLTIPAPDAMAGQSANAGSVTVAPNLMIIFGNSYSMNREMDNKTYPSTASGLPIQSQCLQNYIDAKQAFFPAPTFANDPGCGGSGTPFPDALYGNQPTSKLYIAKEVLHQLLTSPKSDGINFGFATFRQAFGLQLSVSTVLTNAFWPNVFVPGGSQSNPLPGSLASATTNTLNTIGTDPNNFEYVSWWPAWDALLGHPFYLGRSAVDQPHVVASTYSSGGLPYSVQYPTYAGGLGQISSYYENNNPTTGNYYYGSGGLDTTVLSLNVKPTDTPPKFNLCRTYYNSQANQFQGEYLALNADGTPRMVVNTYPTIYNGNTIYFASLNNQQYDANGAQPPQQWSDVCGNFGNLANKTVPLKQTIQLVSDKFNSTPTPTQAYFNYIPSVWDGTARDGLNLPKGTFTGWSGAATYDPSTNTYTAHYPSNAQSAKLMGSYDVSGAKTMGVFMDLPDPALGYKDQRSTIAAWVDPSLPQMDDSGLAYNDKTKTITNASISASHERADYNPHQEPVYDSLMDAYAYYSAYKKQDPYSGCRTNEVLLIYDGHEDANYTTDDKGNVTYADPAVAAAALLKIGVKTNVVIISSNPGDIAQANAIAVAGGTKSAFQVNNASNLLNAISTVFSSLKGDTVSAPPAVPGTVSNGTETFVAASDNTYGAYQGHLYAMKLDANNNPQLDTSWGAHGDAAGMMNTTNRTASLYTDQSGIPQLLSDSSKVPDSVFNATTPSAATIRQYTVNPDYNNGQYLAGRSATSFLGTITSQDAKPQILTKPNNPYLMLNLASYQAYAKSMSTRPQAVLFSSNDGFLYSVNAANGSLNWGYMPSPLLPQLQYYQTFQSSHPMDGGFVVVDSTDASGNWATYVVGTAQTGKIHYALKLDANGRIPSSTTTRSVTLDAPALAATTSAAAPAIWWDSTGKAYALYTTAVTSGGTTKYSLSSMNIGTGAINTVQLGFTPSTPVFVDQTTGGIYLGDTNGNLWYGDTPSNPNMPIVNKIANALPQAVRYVGRAQTPTGIYLWATGDTTIASYQWGSGGWTLAWRTSQTASSSVTNNVTTNYTTDPGTSGTGPQWLPANAQITDASKVAQGVLIVPVTISNTSQLICSATTAVYYLYQLGSGNYPKGQFAGADGKPLTVDPVIGAGTAYSPILSTTTSGDLIVFGSAQQTTSNAVSYVKAFTGAGAPPAGITGWRPVLMNAQ